MPVDRAKEAWRIAEEMAKSGQYELGSTVETIVSSMGFEREVEAWRGQWEQNRLNQLCRESAEPNDAKGGG
jgi:hypothetical protein